MNKISSRDIRLFVAGALALAGFRAWILIPYGLIVSRDSVLIGGAVFAGLALPIGIGIFLGRWSAYFWAQIYLWLKLIGVCIAIPFYWNYFHAKVGLLALKSVPELLVATILLGLIFGPLLKSLDMSRMPDHFAGDGAGRTPEFIEVVQVAMFHWSGSARLRGR
jgi:hypothetical protein